jgi:hypothetical protein
MIIRPENTRWHKFLYAQSLRPQLRNERMLWSFAVYYDKDFEFSVNTINHM